MSTETKVTHTPGPWVVRETPQSSNQDFVVESKHGRRTNHIASVDYQNSDGESEANAHLIAAAPDMLSALGLAAIAITEELAAAGDDEHPTIRRHAETLDAVKAAICNAKGNL